VFAFGDSFDLYTAPADLVAGYWDVGGSQGSLSFPPGRFAGGQGLQVFPNNSISKVSGSNDAVHHFVLAFQQTVALSGTTLGFIIQLADGATNQCCIVFRSDGAILLTSGASTGTILATYAGAITAVGQWFVFEIEVVINNTTGSVTIRKNGNTGTPDFTATSLNTRNSANNYANKITIGAGTTSVSNHLADDFLWRSDPSSVPWVGDIRCYTRMPVSDQSVQFTKAGAPSQSISGTIGIYNAWAANAAHYFSFVPTYSGQIAGATWNTGSGYSGTGNVKFAIYADNGGVPGALLATSSQITNPAVNTQAVTFPSPATVVAGQKYWWGENQDSASLSAAVQNVSGNESIQVNNTTYAGWPASNPSMSGATFNNNQHGFVVNFTFVLNANCVSEARQDGTTSYVFDSVVGDKDFYGIAARNSPAPPATVVAVTTRGFMQRSDAGSRVAAVQVKSGGTTVQSTPTQPASGSFSWLYRTDLTNPNTSAAWAPSAVDAVQVGPCIVS
jgi:hypothetical protein